MCDTYSKILYACVKPPYSFLFHDNSIILVKGVPAYPSEWGQWPKVDMKSE